MKKFTELSKYDELFEDLEHSHSEFQIENFILGEEQGITVWGKYKQALRELHKRVRGIRQAIIDIEKNKIEIKRLDRKIDRLNKNKPLDHDLDAEEAKLDIMDKQSANKLNEKLLKDIYREADVFYKVVQELKPQIQNKDKKEMESDYWDKKLKMDLQNCVLSRYGASIGMLRAIRGMKSEKLVKSLLDTYFGAVLQDKVDGAKLIMDAQKILKLNEAKKEK